MRSQGVQALWCPLWHCVWLAVGLGGLAIYRWLCVTVGAGECCYVCVVPYLFVNDSVPSAYLFADTVNTVAMLWSVLWDAVALAFLLLRVHA